MWAQTTKVSNGVCVLLCGGNNCCLRNKRSSLYEPTWALYGQCCAGSDEDASNANGSDLENVVQQVMEAAEVNIVSVFCL